MDWLSAKIDKALTWIGDLFKAVFGALWDALTDLFVELLDLFLVALAAVISAIPAPSFLANGGLGVLFQGLPSQVQFLLVATGLIDGLAIIGAGVVFYLVRKVVTLGQW